MTQGQAPAGWYPVNDGRLCYWDGAAWTNQFQQAPGSAEKSGSAMKSAFAGTAGLFTAQTEELPAGTVWSAVGKPLTGVGAGRYRMDDRYLYFEKGTLRTDSQQVALVDVIDVDVAQTMAQKARGVFNVAVHVQRLGRTEVVTMVDIPDGRTAQRTVNDAAYEARSAAMRAQNTMRHESAPAPAAAAPTAVSTAPGNDLMAQITKLAEMKTAGLLTDDEFAAAKARLLA